MWKQGTNHRLKKYPRLVCFGEISSSIRSPRTLSLKQTKIPQSPEDQQWQRAANDLKVMMQHNISPETWSRRKKKLWDFFRRSPFRFVQFPPKKDRPVYGILKHQLMKFGASILFGAVGVAFPWAVLHGCKPCRAQKVSDPIIIVSIKIIGATTIQVLKTHASIDAGNESLFDLSKNSSKRQRPLKTYYNYGHHPWEVLRKLRAPLKKSWKTTF